ncbi:tryptophan synthase subunit alpha [Sphingosinicella sp. CPCC 101087]|uniref:tryptophan synthase subunit alpha n=1 Tax=Sphingosinicella sp. CPCC 101087 TaxID=2497754 RepID=UPI00101CD577|nr:tryptophan synthase subunit alpha [Sphingosinicella sp. CPCC 101087]
MSRYDEMFARLRTRGDGAFGGFLMLGDPDLETSLGLLDALVAGGADMIEVGIPFSDPIADGPVIQAAAVRALEAGVTPADCFELLAAFRARHPRIPVGLLTYANLVLARGREAFYRRCASAGIDSVLVADVPAAEAEPFAGAARDHGIAPVLIAAANTPDAVLERIASLCEGYVYCVSRAGVTGADRAMDSGHERLFQALAAAGAPPPVLGFGISRPEHVRTALDSGAAGVISGSAIVRLVEQAGDKAAAVRAFVAGLKAATAQKEVAREAARG